MMALTPGIGAFLREIKDECPKLFAVSMGEDPSGMREVTYADGDTGIGKVLKIDITNPLMQVVNSEEVLDAIEDVMAYSIDVHHEVRACSKVQEFFDRFRETKRVDIPEMNSEI